MKPTFKRIIIAALNAGITASVVNSILFFIFQMAGIITDDIHIQKDQPLTIMPVIISTILPSLLAGIVFYLLTRYTKNGYRVFSVMAIILLLASFANPFLGIEGITIAMALSLNVMHVVVVASLLYFFGSLQKHTQPVLKR